MPGQISSRNVVNFLVCYSGLITQRVHVCHAGVGMSHMREKRLVVLIEQKTLRAFKNRVFALADSQRLNLIREMVAAIQKRRDRI